MDTHGPNAARVGSGRVAYATRPLARTVHRHPRMERVLDRPAPRFFGAFPARGIWTPLGLSRGQFFAILGGSIALFALVGGPVWMHLRDGHFARITVSYGAIPVAVAVALHRNGRAGLRTIAVASAVLSLLKLVATAALLVVLALAR